MIIDKLRRFFNGNTSDDVTTAQPRDTRPTAPKVYRGRTDIKLPPFAVDQPTAKLVEACKKNVVCSFICHMTQHRIYGEDPSGTVEHSLSTYEGVTVSCDPLKRYGQEVASEDGLSGRYTYADLNHIIQCCCGKPDKCRFYNKAIKDFQ